MPEYGLPALQGGLHLEPVLGGLSIGQGQVVPLAPGAASVPDAERQSLMAVTRGAADLLVVTGGTLRDTGVDHRPHVALVDSQAEGRCGHHQVEPVMAPVVDDAPAFTGVGDLADQLRAQIGGFLVPMKQPSRHAILEHPGGEV